MITSTLMETIRDNIAKDRELPRTAIDAPRWTYWPAGTYPGTPTHIGEVNCRYSDNGYRAIYGFDADGNVDCYMD